MEITIVKDVSVTYTRYYAIDIDKKSKNNTKNQTPLFWEGNSKFKQPLRQALNQLKSIGFTTIKVFSNNRYNIYNY